MYVVSLLRSKYLQNLFNNEKGGKKAKHQIKITIDTQEYAIDH